MYEIDTATVYQVQVIKISTWEWALAFNIFILFLIFSFRQKMLMIDKHPEYKYYVWGFYAKFFASVGFVCVYYFVYHGGDTFSYFESAMSMANLFYKDPIAYLDVLFSKASPESMSNFDFFTGYPYAYLSEDPRTYMVIKLVSPLAIVTGNSYLLTSIIIGLITYIGSWRLFQLFHNYYPKISLQLALGILFFPSVLFWGSGVLKDSFTLLSTCLFMVNYHKIFIKKEQVFPHIIWLIIHALIIIGIKPYILMILFPGILFWTFYLRYTRIKVAVVKLILLPIIILFSLGFTVIFFSTIGGENDKFAVENALQTASVTQTDLKQSYYQGKSFDVGDFDGSPRRAIELFPNATFAGLFRPFITEADSAFMLLSALENLVLLYLTVTLFLRLNFMKTFTVIFGDPLVLFCLLFGIFFGYMLGLTTSNYGALIRFKIPLIPFFVSGLVIAKYHMNPSKYNREKK